MLLSQAEKDFLLQTKELSKTQQRFIRYKLRKNVKQFYNNELPLLINKGYIVVVTVVPLGAGRRNERQLGLHKGGGGGSGSIEIMLNIVTELDGRESTRQTRKWHYDGYGSLT